MKVLVAEDSLVARRLLSAHLERWGYEVLAATDGAEAWSMLEDDAGIAMAIVDWEMPRLDGVSLCRRIRETDENRILYVLLCTARNRLGDVVEGLNAGADDYLTKPIVGPELRARLRVGERTVRLKCSLQERVQELESALAHVKRLQGLLPICMYCRRIRDKKNVWQRIEGYLEQHADVAFSHGLCDVCLHKYHRETAE